MNKIIFSFQVSIHIFCLVHISQILLDMIYPAEPSVRTYKENLNDIEFPMTLRLCLELKEGRNDSILKDLGYANIRDYFKGISMYNESIIGWAGHSKDGSSTLASVEGRTKGYKIIKCSD